MSTKNKIDNLSQVKQPEVRKLTPEQEKQLLYASIQNFVSVQGTDEALDRQNEKFSLLEYRRQNKKSQNPMIGEAKPHVVTFPKEFYTELLRLLGLPYDDESLKKKPPIIAKITNELIYRRFPKGTLEELQNLNPVTSDGFRLLKHFQLLTALGEAHLKQFIDDVINVAKDCDTYSQFYQRLRKKMGHSWQLNLFEEYN